MEHMKQIIGWREWLALPELGIPSIKAKIDTGARTSSLHAFFVESFFHNEQKMVRFSIHPLQNNHRLTVDCEAPVIDERIVTDSGGHSESRFVIESQATLLGHSWPIEITLSNRDSMMFRMLLGRTALAGRFLVDTEASFISGRELGTFYKKRKK